MCPEDGNLNYIVAVLVSDYAIYFQSHEMQRFNKILSVHTES